VKQVYLKRIEMKGFKSFANRTALNFEPGITCIVGPNGSGKSNISDAIKWVLGEQSSKALRGEKMEDVIFAGTHQRKATGYAEISLILDNEERSLPIDYSEVAITRRLYRSGESVYAINRKSVRLKDIRDIMFDTGLGVNGYSMISQGKIDHILSKDSSERRAVFEEAVGIAKIKSKKEETGRKLERTEQNLERVQDILLELEQQLEPLQVEAEEAKKYKLLFEDMRSLDVSLVINDHDHTKKRVMQIRERNEFAQERLSLLTDDRMKLRENLNERETFFVEKEEALHEAEQQHQALQIQEANLDHESSRIKEKEETLEKQRLALEEKSESTKALQAEEGGRFSIIEEEFLALNHELDNIETELSQLDSGNEELEIQRASMMEALDQKRKSLHNLTNRLSQAKELHNEYRQKYFEVTGEKNRYEDLLRQQNEKAVTKEAELEKIMAKQKEEAASLRKNQEDYDKSGLKREALIYQLREEKNTLSQVDHDLDRIGNKIQFEKRAIDGYEGYFRGVRQIMGERDNEPQMKKRILGVVTDLIDVQPKYHKAIETALGNALQNIVVRTEDDLKSIVRTVKKKRFGRITILPMDLIRPKSIPERDQDAGMLASEAVNCKDEFVPVVQFLLARTFIAETMDEGLAIAKKTNMRYRVVTIDGNLIRPGGAVSTGELNREGGLLERKSLLSQYLHEKETCTNKKQSIQTRLQGIAKELEEQERLMQENKDRKDFIEIQVKTLLNQVTFLQRDHETLIREKRGYQNTYEQLCHDEERMNHQIMHAHEDQNNLADQQTILETEIEEGSTKMKDLERKMLKDLNVRQPKEVQRASLLEKIHHKEFLRNEYQNRMSAFQSQLDEGQFNLTRNREDRIGIQRKIQELDQQTTLMLSRLTDAEERRNALTQEIQEAKQTSQSMNQRYYEIDDELSELKDRLRKDEVTLTKSEMQEKQQVEYLWEQYQMSIAMARKIVLEDFAVATARSTVKTLKKQIRELGEVNLTSIQKFEEVNERFTFLSQQQADLLSAKRDLESLIHELVDSMEKSFLAEMEAIRKQFTQTFTHLFGGGDADIQLLDPSQPLTTPIRIVAQPPGKKLSNISVLSGGEKALTAIALMFAIIQLKPTPFCVLDEIEAALDDANIKRFTDFLQEHSAMSQFIIITHKQETMRVAKVLYGITMPEKGVSSVLSVKLEDLKPEEYIN
jgi:chromosome segregation protein